MSDYEAEINAKLQAARARARKGKEFQALKVSAPSLFEVIDGEITLEINRGYGNKPLSYEEYLESHGAVRGIKRIRDLLDSAEREADSAIQEVTAIEGQIKQFTDDKKQQ